MRNLHLSEFLDLWQLRKMECTQQTLEVQLQKQDDPNIICVRVCVCARARF